MVYANGRMDNPLDHSPGFAKAAHKALAVELLLRLGESHSQNPVGVSLLAIAFLHSTGVSTDSTPSRAGSLLRGDV
ncbi:hypothetical protein C1893_23595 [Pseudomonas sp. MPR-ANC1]|nr:hypothetical protein C1893_23595 [Pseudomonas sp. MPR-ANC1]